MLLLFSAIIVVAQVHASRWSAAHHDPYLQRIILYPTQQGRGEITLAAPRTWGHYSVDLIFPGNVSPLDFGMAFHEVRKNVQVAILQAHRQQVLLNAPNFQSLTQLEDQLDARGGVELCDFRAPTSDELVISLRATDGPPWPQQVEIGISHSTAEAKIQSSRHLTKAAQPFSFGFSALLALMSLALCWRSNPS